MTSTFTEPGWQRDPTARYPQRWWNGQSWGEDVLDEHGGRLADPQGVVHSGTSSPNPATPVVTADHPNVAAGWHSDPAAAYPERWWDGQAWSSHVHDEKGQALTHDPGPSRYPAPGSPANHPPLARTSGRGVTSAGDSSHYAPSGWSGQSSHGPSSYGPSSYGPRPTNTMAILALVFAFVFTPLGIIFGFIARSQIRRTGEGGDGLALAGIIIGFVWLAIIVIALFAAFTSLASYRY